MNEAPLAEWLETAATFSLPGPGVSRYFLTDEHRRLLDWLNELMPSCGLTVELDHAGNLVGRKPSKQSEQTLYFGSHQDTVSQGGAYDGILGILLPLAVLYELREVELPFAVELIAFGDEEGTRFQSTLVGSSAVAGCFDQATLEFRDDQGVSVAEALRRFGLQPEKIPELARNKDKALGFIEVHIEQGPVLEKHDLPVGLVSAITGIERHQIHIQGMAGHAGTVPMAQRKDAMVAASRYVLWLDRYCREREQIVGVIGKLEVVPNSVNVIPDHVLLTVELRSPDTEKRLDARAAMQALDKELSVQGFTINRELTYSREGVQCDAALAGRLQQAIEAEEIPVLSLFSGAGHDGLAMTYLCPVAMLFVRCKDGLSHHPDEAIDMHDALVAKRILKTLLLQPEPFYG